MKKAFNMINASNIPNEMAQGMAEGVERLDLVLREQLAKHGPEIALNSLATSSAGFLTAIITAISDEELDTSLLDEYLRIIKDTTIFCLKRVPAVLTALGEEETNCPK